MWEGEKRRHPSKMKKRGGGAKVSFRPLPNILLLKNDVGYFMTKTVTFPFIFIWSLTLQIQFNNQSIYTLAGIYR